jgi:hypothetical protein
VGKRGKGTGGDKGEGLRVGIREKGLGWGRV